MTLDAIRAAFEASKEPPAEALRAAVPHAAALAPAIIEMVDKAADGVLLTPRQDRWLFYGIHILAAARHTALYLPLMRLLHRPQRELEIVIGDADSGSLPRVVLSVYAGDVAPLIAAIEDRAMSGVLRWGMFEVLARLAFDGVVPRATALAVVDRFDDERLAPDDDVAWMGWQESIVLLAAGDRLDRVRAAWREGRGDQREADQRDWEDRLSKACADPADPARFVLDNVTPIDDPMDALRWLLPRDVPANQEGEEEEREEESKLASKALWADDPAKEIALDDDELEWLDAFLAGPQVPESAMPLEALDGFLAALAVGPETVMPSEFMPEIWAPEGKDTAVYDSTEQVEYVLRLLLRHWDTIVRRVEADFLHVPLFAPGDEAETGRDWGRGFLRGIKLRPEAWAPMFADDANYRLVGFVAMLSADERETVELGAKPLDRSDPGKLRQAAAIAVIGMHHYWRDVHRARARARPAARQHRKIGRNERCPCGSGRKYKVCCGAAATPWAQ